MISRVSPKCYQREFHTLLHWVHRHLRMGVVMLVPLVFLREWGTGGSIAPPLTSHISLRASNGDLLGDLEDASVDSSFRCAIELCLLATKPACLPDLKPTTSRNEFPNEEM